MEAVSRGRNRRKGRAAGIGCGLFEITRLEVARPRVESKGESNRTGRRKKINRYKSVSRSRRSAGGMGVK